MGQGFRPKSSRLKRAFGAISGRANTTAKRARRLESVRTRYHEREGGWGDNPPRGRRYKQFDAFDGWKAMKEQAWKSFRLAEPIAAKHRVKLAVENHNDWRIDDLLEFVEGIKSEWFGLCLDTVNSMALLEDPLETVSTLVPYVFTTHVKDMGVREYSDGFLLWEVPLGRGFLDLNRIFHLCENENPKVQFCLEMITRDPLEIPCLTQDYWATFQGVEPRQLARALQMVRADRSDGPLPKI